jgi:hypothetical protein
MGAAATRMSSPANTTEPSELRRLPAWFYDWAAAPRYDAETHAGLRDALRTALLGDARPAAHGRLVSGR